MPDRTPAEVFPPGDFILEELEEREWTQEDFARILGKPLPTVNQIIKGKRSITPDTAKRIAAAFGTSAELWLNLEASWQLSQSGEDVSAVRDRAVIYDTAPVREMVRRKWIKKTKTPDELALQLTEHFGVSDLSLVPETRAAARSSISGEMGEMTSEQWAWVCRCRRVSSLVSTRSYAKSRLVRAVTELKTMTMEPESISAVPKILAEAGVRMVVVEHLKSTKIDGAALQKNPGEPVVAVSLRFGRLDNFWHTLLHEIAHVLNDDGVSADSEIYKRGRVIADAEEVANKMASEWLVPRNKLDSFILRTAPLFSTRKVTNFARRIGVHPSIVAGQLRHRGEIPWENLHRLNVDVRDLVRGSNISDGWGEPAPLE